MATKHVLVCGAGSIGKRHIANLLKLGALVSVWRSRRELLEEITRDYPVRPCEDLSTAIREADAVVVATATDQHIGIAVKTLEAGRPLFIEKPVSHEWTEVERLLQLGKGKPVEVGCQLRAHPGLMALKGLLQKRKGARPFTYRLVMGHRLDAWRTGQDYRRSYSSRSDRGGGALFDLIHQIDLALWFFGPVESVNAVLSNVSDLEIHGDDVANLLLTHASGVTGHIQLDMCSPVHRCEAEVIASESVYRWSNTDGKLRRFSPDGEDIIQEVLPGFERNDLFLKIIAHFLKHLDDPLLPAFCSLESGAEALKVALGARKSHAQGKAYQLGN